MLQGRASHGAFIHRHDLRAWLAFFFTGVITAVLAPAFAAWQGSEVVKDGVTHVMNPAQPSEGRREVAMRELWSLGVDNEDEIFGVVRNVFRDEQGNFYLLDSQLSQIQVYSPAGAFIKSIGRPGEGPGEFRNPADACFLPDGRIAVAQVFPGKAILFNRDATPAGELPLKLNADPAAQTFLVLLEMKPAAKNIAVTCLDQTFANQVLTQTYKLAIFDPNGILQRTILEFGGPVDVTKGIPISEVEAGRFTKRWDVAGDGTIYTPVEFHGYAIHVYAPDGKLQRVIERESRPVMRTPAERTRFEELFSGYARNAPNVRIEVEDSHADIQSITIRPDGTLWVLTGEGQWRAPQGSLGVYDVFDKDGRFREQVSLKGAGDPREDGVYLLGDRIIVVRNLMAAIEAAEAGASETASETGAEEVPEAGVTISCYGM